MNMFEVWLLLVLIPKLPFLFVPIGLVAMLMCVISTVLGLSSWEDVKDVEFVQRYKDIGAWDIKDEIRQTKALKGVQNSKKVFRLGVIFLCISAILVAAVPDKKEIAAIVLIPYISNNPEFKKLPENMVGMLNDLIKEYRAELSPEKLGIGK